MDQSRFAHLEALTAEQKAEVAARYIAGESSLKLAIIFGTTKPTILKAIRQAGIVRRDPSTAKRTHSIDIAAFDVVTETSAYWAGFLMADGCIHGNQVQLWLSDRDAGHIAKFKAFLKSTHPIGMRPARQIKNRRGKNKTYIGRPCCGLAFWCKPLAEALARYGVTQDKTKRGCVVSLQNNPHFWRGMIDGDGSLYNLSPKGRKRRPCWVTLIGSSKTAMEQYSAFLKLNFPGCAASLKRRDSYWQVNVSGRYALLLLKALYQDCSVALSRKHEHALQILANHPVAPTDGPQLPPWTADDLRFLQLQHGTMTAVARAYGLHPKSLWRLFQRQDVSC